MLVLLVLGPSSLFGPLFLISRVISPVWAQLPGGAALAESVSRDSQQARQRVVHPGSNQQRRLRKLAPNPDGTFQSYGSDASGLLFRLFLPILPISKSTMRDNLLLVKVHDVVIYGTRMRDTAHCAPKPHKRKHVLMYL